MNFKPISVLNKRMFRQNKGRNLVAVLAIVLTTVMFTTLFVLSQSMNKNLVEMAFRQTGYDAQTSFKSITKEQAEKIAAHPDVAEVGSSIVAGLGQGKALAGRQVEVRYADESYAKHSFAEPSTGRMPQTAEEIAVDTIILDRLGVPYELGQRIRLEWIADSTEKENRISEFTLCGFWEGNESVYASMAWVSREFAEGVASELPETDVSSRIAGMYMVQVSLYDDRNIEAAMDKILEETGLADLEYGVNLAYDPDINRMAAQENLPMYLGMILVFVAGYLIIYNIFQISVTADIQFYGKLKTLGMTARQLRKRILGQ
ncbi:MAG: ABC transporter permease, partial [Lachnospiraceae bacterium]|nr:ABC transporter permease [Lachnospiraceae bacterium]